MAEAEAVAVAEAEVAEVAAEAVAVEVAAVVAAEAEVAAEVAEAVAEVAAAEARPARASPRWRAPVVALTRPPAAITVLPTATLAVNERAASNVGAGDQVFVAGSYLETSFSPSKVGIFVPPIAYSCPCDDCPTGGVLRHRHVRNWSAVVHASVAMS